ncbi:MAG: glycosyltransferase family 2 protein [Chloroherpetonaceae bacterium]|nr:glycosyltransferase family 2 protein [Chloroherpetonaceae bacterium]
MSLQKNKPFFSIVIPAHNEEGSIEETLRAIATRFQKELIDDYEILVINDNSRDKTEEILKSLSAEIPQIRYLNNTPPNGFGFAVRKGLENFEGEAVAIVMADLSDHPDDIVVYYKKIKEGYECVFGSRFIKGGKVYDYPTFKLGLNRLANWFIKTLFNIKHNDMTNAFKAYRREVLNGLQPLIAYHFNLTVELPLKAIVRGYNFAVVPISWTNRKAGESKLKIKEMGSRYLFIVLYIWLEKMLSRGDYKRKPIQK